MGERLVAKLLNRLFIDVFCWHFISHDGRTRVFLGLEASILQKVFGASKLELNTRVDPVEEMTVEGKESKFAWVLPYAIMLVFLSHAASCTGPTVQQAVLNLQDCKITKHARASGMSASSLDTPTTYHLIAKSMSNMQSGVPNYRRAFH